MTDPKPTPLDTANAAARQAIAERQNAEYAEAVRLAMGALGPGWTPWMKLCLIDADHRRTGNAEPVATVFKVNRREQKLSENSLFLRRLPDGSIRKAKGYEELFGELLVEKHPTRTVEVRGQQVPVGRYELVWGALELYQPRSAEQLAALRASRERAKAEREEQAWREQAPLFTVWAERVQDEERGDSTRHSSP